MILVVTGIGSLIHIYSTGYMHEETDSEYARYFSYLNLFASFMLVLVLGANFPVMFVGWEGVGLCSYLLIGFWFTKQSAADAGKKAFIVNRIGDFGFMLGDAADLRDVRHARLPGGRGRGRRARGRDGRLGRDHDRDAAAVPRRDRQVGADSALRLAAGRDGRPDAGLRADPRGDDGDGGRVHDRPQRRAVRARADTLAVVAGIGAATALMAGTIGLVQNDIKRVLAYSTVSQLGYMFLAMGVGAYAAGIFHLYTHAFFKALLFLGSGAVIHALAGEQDMRNMGGLKKYLPITYWTFLIGALAIAGVPLLSGFFSKDEILFRTFVGTTPPSALVLWVHRRGHVAADRDLHVPAGVPDVPRRAPARARRRRMPRTRSHAHAAHGAATCAHDAHGAWHGHGHAPHDAPPSMAIPLIVLAIGRCSPGYVGVPHALGGSNRIERFLEPSFEVAARRRDAPARRARREPAAVRTAAEHGQPAHAADAAHDDDATELMLMARLDRHRRSPASASPCSSGCAGPRRCRRRMARAVRAGCTPAAEQVLRGRDLRRRDRPADQAAVDRRRCGRASTPA